MKYSVNFDKELGKERAVEQWVLGWCRKYHPEAFEEARAFINAPRKKNKKKS